MNKESSKKKRKSSAMDEESSKKKLVEFENHVYGLMKNYAVSSEISYLRVASWNGGEGIEKLWELLRAFAMENWILSYFTISKNYFINYTILFYNTPNIPIFIFLLYSLKYYILSTKII